MIQNGVTEMPPIKYTWRGSLYGLGTALCFSFSSIFIRFGLEGLDSPLLGVTVGMVISAFVYGLMLFFRQGKASFSALKSLPNKTLALQILAGILVGVSTWARWTAIESAPVGVVIALGRLSIPVILILAPYLVGRGLERVTARVWLGAGLILAGAFILTFLAR